MSDLVETGTEPEFFISEIPKWEITGGGAALRLYVACQKDGKNVLQFTAVASLQDFARMARQVLNTASGVHETPFLIQPADIKAH